MSVSSLCAAHAEDASLQSLQLTQASQSKSERQSSGACTPIGLTANGDIVFPWECRETIEKQRGPISVSLPSLPSDAPAETRRQEAVATVATVHPKVDDMVGRPASSPEVNESATLGKPRLPVKRATETAKPMPKPGQKVQHATLRLQQGSKAAADPKKDKVVAQSGAKPK
jgi:hypothetical protein